MQLRGQYRLGYIHSTQLSCSTVRAQFIIDLEIVKINKIGNNNLPRKKNHFLFP